jgi:predicted MFS family arabinose efflux permease
MAVGGMTAIIASGFAVLLASRILIGIGAGLFSPTTGPLTVAWFPAREQPYVNTLITIMGSLGTSLAFVVTVPLLDAAGSWRLVLGLVALVPLALALGWVIGGRQAPAALAPHPQITVEEEFRHMESGIVQAIKRREIVLLAVAVVGQVWVFNTLTTYLPSYFETVHGLDKIAAGSITGILPIAGIAGGLLCGTACGMSGRRRPFLWPLMFAMLVSALVVALLPPGPLVYLAIAVFGFASTGCSVPILTTSMDLPGTNPQLVGGAIAVIYGLAFILSFFASPLFGLVAPLVGMRTALVVFSLPLVVSVAALYRIPETGPGPARAAVLG